MSKASRQQERQARRQQEAERMGNYAQEGAKKEGVEDPVVLPTPSAVATPQQVQDGQNEPPKMEVASEVTLTEVPKTLDEAKTGTRESLIKVYGSKSNAIRGLKALGMKIGDIAKKLDVIYQHARNVSLRPLKREIAAQREAQKNAGAKPADAQAQSQGGNDGNKE